MVAKISDAEITALMLERLASELLLEARRLRAKAPKRSLDGNKQLLDTLKAARQLTRRQ